MRHTRLITIPLLAIILIVISCDVTAVVRSVNSGQVNIQMEESVKPVSRKNLVAEWLFQGNAFDSSRNGNNGIVHGAVLTVNRFGKKNMAYRFNGASDYIEANIPANALKGDFTLCFWAKPENFDNLSATMISSRNYNFLFQSLGRNIGLEKQYCPEFYFYDDKTQAHIGKTTSRFRMTADRWVFIVAQRKGNDSRMIVNMSDRTGRAVSDPSSFRPVIDRLFFAKTEFNRAPEFFPGVLDDIRLYSRVLDEDELQALYHVGGWTNNDDAAGQQTTALGKPVTVDNGQMTGLQDRQFPNNVSGIVAEWLLNGNAADTSGNGFDGVIHDTILTSNRFGKNNKAYRFDGNTSYIEVPVPSGALKNKFTLCFWMNMDHFNNFYATIIGNPKNSIICQVVNEAMVFYFYNYDKGVYYGKIMGQNKIKTKEWNFVAVKNDGKNITMLINAKDREGPVTADPAISELEIDKLFIGRALQGPPHVFFPGSIDDIQLYDRALTEVEIRTMFEANGWKQRPEVITDHNTGNYRGTEDKKYKEKEQIAEEPGLVPIARPQR